MDPSTIADRPAAHPARDRATWLLAAEADKIQSFVFGSAALKQVRGGSSLLDDFGRIEARSLIEDSGLDVTVIVADGGAFRLLVHDATAADAVALGETIANHYAYRTGGSMSVAAPVAVEPGAAPTTREDATDSEGATYRSAAEEAERRLREAKRAGAPRAIELMPLAALCDDCALAPAERRERLTDTEPARYLCGPCRTKLAFYREQTRDSFLNEILEAATTLFGRPMNAPVAQDLDGLAKVDPNREIAFIVGDGNGMGVFFSGARSAEDASGRSEQLHNALVGATAAMLAGLRAAQVDDKRRVEILPAIPLIVAGDDLFIAVPACYALAAADRYARVFEERMRSAHAQPTVALGIVVAKPSEPYALAHDRGEALLGRAKGLCRRLLTRHSNKPVSALAFEHIPSGYAPAAADADGFVRGFQPYLTGGYAQEHAALLRGEALHVTTLIEAAAKLAPGAAKPLPTGRVQALRALFDRADRGTDRWQRRLDTLLERIGRDAGERHAEPRQQVVDLLTSLGGPAESGYWYVPDRAAEQPPAGAELPQEGVAAVPARRFHALSDAIAARTFARPLGGAAARTPEVAP